MPIFGKRMDGVRGRRGATRERVLLSASVLTLERSRTGVLLDVSATGARLRDCGEVVVGHDLWIKVGVLDTLATVAWAENDLCGVTFDEPLSEEDLNHLKREARNMLVTRLTPEERLAAEDWICGFAR